MRHRYGPSDAMMLMRTRSIVSFACDVAKNRAFARADARTRDAHGRRIADYVSTAGERELWPTRIAHLLQLPVEEFTTAMRAEPVRMSKVLKPGGGERPIVVPSFTRRCVSNVISRVLAITGDHLLPSTVRAYRPGDEDGVRGAVLDVAEWVHEGQVRFWAKLDIKSYFTRIPWRAVERALQHYGYSKEFTGFIMAAVRCTAVERKNGKNVPVDVTCGAQQGLPESSTVANMVPWKLDELLVRDRKLVLIRYSDDIFIGAKTRGEVVAGVRAVAAWCREHELALKGVAPNTRLANLVHDIKRTKVPLLGTEIDASGYVHMPPKKLEAKLSELQQKFERIPPLDEVRAISRYGNGGGADAYDNDDVRSTMQAFLDYWGGLDPRATERAEEIFKNRFPLTPGCSGRGTVWTAQLWRIYTGCAAGTSPTAHSPINLSDPRPPATRTPPTGASRGQDGAGNRSSTSMAPPPALPGTTGRPFAGTSTPDVDDSEPEPYVTLPVEVVDLLDGVAAADDVERCSMLVDDDSLYTALVDREDASSLLVEEEVALPLDADGLESYRFNSRPALTGGASGDPDGGASPSFAGLENGVTVFVHAVGARVGGQRLAVVGVQYRTGRAHPGTPQVAVYPHRPEVALTREMLKWLHVATSVPVAFAMEATWLSKGLLQRERRFGAPILFSLVLELHEKARGLEHPVFVVGGVEVPHALARAVHATIDDLQRQAA